MSFDSTLNDPKCTEQSLSSQSSSQNSQRRSLFDYRNESTDQLITKTKMLRLEILMKVLYGRGLFFYDTIMVAKKCWQNANFEGAIGMNYKDDQLVYQKTTRHRRIALLMVCAKIYLLIIENRVSSRRQIYYEVKDIFTARQCYDLIEQICAFVNLSRRELNICASGKGLVAGDLTLLFENDVRMNILDFERGCLVPDSLIYLTKAVTDARYLLVIEKDSIFKKLVDADFHLTHNCILVTSKGYPDVYTRELVNIISEKNDLKIFALFDCDPFALDIFCCFKFGSVNLMHHNQQLSSNKLIWLGIYPTEIPILKLANAPFTQNDQRRMNSLLERVYVKDDSFLMNEFIYLDQIKVKTGLQDLHDTIFNLIPDKVTLHLSY